MLQASGSAKDINSHNMQRDCRPACAMHSIVACGGRALRLHRASHRIGRWLERILPCKGCTKQAEGFASPSGTFQQAVLTLEILKSQDLAPSRRQCGAPGLTKHLL